MKHYFIIKVLPYKALIYFQERSNVISIPGRQGPLAPSKKNKKLFEFQRKPLKTTILRNLETTTWNIPELLLDQKPFATRKFCKFKKSQNIGISRTQTFAHRLKKDFSRPLTFANGQINMIKFSLRTHDSKKDGKQIPASIFRDICYCDQLKFRSC